MLWKIRRLQVQVREQQKSQAQIETLMKMSPAALFQVSTEAKCLYVNQAWCQFTGLSSQDALGDGWKSGLLLEDVDRVMSVWRAGIQKKEPVQVHYRYRSKEGDLRWIHTKGVPHFDETGELVCYYGASIDFSKQKQIESELRESQKLIEEQRLKIIHSEKMSALGEMAGGIAHEINNPLAVIELNAGQLKRRLKQAEAPEELSFYTERISGTVARIAKIVKGLKMFARDGESDPFEAASVFTLIQEAVEFCQGRFHQHHVNIDVPYFPKSLTVESRAVQLSQVFLNLLNNAFDAVHGKPSPWVRVDVQEQGDWVEIRVTDSGPGIAPEIAAKIMQPFFTTKEVGKGTGLGLSVSQAIVRSHGGTLELDRQATNTCFVVRLPKFQNPAEVRRAN